MYSTDERAVILSLTLPLDEASTDHPVRPNATSAGSSTAGSTTLTSLELKEGSKLVYAVRLPGAPVVVDAEHLSRFVAMGEMVADAPLETLLRVVQDVYRPLLVAQCGVREYPDVLRNDMVRVFHEYTSSIQMELAAQRGEAYLPMPAPEVLQDLEDLSAAAVQRSTLSTDVVGVVRSLEDCVRGWAAIVDPLAPTERQGKAQLRAALLSRDGPLDEIDYWERRVHALASIQQQLRGDMVRIRIEPLLQAFSSIQCVPLLASLRKRVHAALFQAKVRQRHLAVLRPHLEQMQSVENYADLARHIPVVMHLLGLIGAESPLCLERLPLLCARLSHLMSQRAVAYVTAGGRLLGGDRTDSAFRIHVVLATLREYRAQLDRRLCSDAAPADVREVLASPGAAVAIFGRLDEFTLRLEQCAELIEKLDLFRLIADIKVGGVKGEDLTLALRQLHDDFTRQVRHLDEFRADSLDPDSDDFEELYYAIRTHFKRWETRLASIISHACDECSSAHDALALLDTFGTLLAQPSMRELLKRRLMDLFRLMHRGLEDAVSTFHAQKHRPPRLDNTPTYAGHVSWSRALLGRMSVLAARVQANRALFPAEEVAHFSRRFDEAEAALLAFGRDQHTKWVKRLASSSLSDTLKKPLLRRLTRPDDEGPPLKPCGLAVNFDETLTELLKEVRYFLLLRMNVPTEAMAIYDQAALFRKYIALLDMIADQYNASLRQLHSSEMPLLQSTFAELDSLLGQALGTTLTWESGGVPQYLNRVLAGVNEFHDRVLALRSNTHAIQRIARQWSASSPIVARGTHALVLADSIEEVQGKIAAIQADHDRIRELVHASRQCFDPQLMENLDEIAEEYRSGWHAYLRHVDVSIGRGLVAAVESTLRALNSRMSLDSSGTHRVLLSTTLALCEARRHGPRVAQFEPPLSGSEGGLFEMFLKLLSCTQAVGSQLSPLCGEPGLYADAVASSGAVQSLGRNLERRLASVIAQCEAYRVEFSSEFSFLWRYRSEQFLVLLERHGAEVWHEIESKDHEASLASRNSITRRVSRASLKRLSLKSIEAASSNAKREPSGTWSGRDTGGYRHLLEMAGRTGSITSLTSATDPGHGGATLDDFDDLLSELSFQAQHISSMPVQTMLDFVALDMKSVRSELIATVRSWSTYFRTFLSKRLTTLLDNISAFVDSTEAGLNQPVSADDYNVLVSVMKHIHVMRTSAHLVEQDLNPARQLMVILQSHDVALPATVSATLEQLPMRFAALRRTCDMVSKVTHPLQRQQMDKTQRNAEAFRAHVRTAFRSRFNQDAPYSMVELTESPGQFAPSDSLVSLAEDGPAQFRQPDDSSDGDDDDDDDVPSSKHDGLAQVEVPFPFEVRESAGPMRRLSASAAMARLHDLDTQLYEKAALAEELREMQRLFDLPIDDFDDVHWFAQELAALRQLWDRVAAVDSLIHAAGRTFISGFHIDECESKLTVALAALEQKTPKAVRSAPAFAQCKAMALRFLEVLPELEQLQRSYLGTRHWSTLARKLATHRELSPDSTVASLIELDLMTFRADIRSVVELARREQAVEQQLRELELKWQSEMRLEFGVHATSRRDPPSDETTPLISNAQALFRLLDEHQVAVQASLAAGDTHFFSDPLQRWKADLTRAGKVLSAWLDVQSTWASLEPIFIGQADVATQLPDAVAEFGRINSEWQELMRAASQSQTMMEAVLRDGLRDQLARLRRQLVPCEFALNRYVHNKRQAFPRLYFVSKADLVAMLSEGHDPKNLAPFLPKLFAGVVGLHLSENGLAVEKISGCDVGSTATECLPLVEPVQCASRPVELWLADLVQAMRKSVKAALGSALSSMQLVKYEQWLKQHCSQLVLLASQTHWASEVEGALELLQNGSSDRALRDLLRERKARLQRLIHLVQQDPSVAADRSLQRKLVTLITLDVHARDVVQGLVDGSVTDPHAFGWQRQLRPYWADDNELCYVMCCDTSFAYNFEYLGNSPRLVVTPLTDRCYITLTQAMQLGSGGAPCGPAGTGKTETVKDLGKALGKFVLVQNVSEQLDQVALGTLLRGVSQTGTWICFDEFNRLSLPAMSIASSQLKSIFDAIRKATPHVASLIGFGAGRKEVGGEEEEERASESRSASGSQRQSGGNLDQQGQDVAEAEDPDDLFYFEGDQLRIDPSCAMFITMNPGYAGRRELPQSLWAMFRPVTMIVPDMRFICEILLLAQGFQAAQLLAHKFVELFRLSASVLSTQSHYDWGLRPLKSIVRAAGAILHSQRYLDDMDEEGFSTHRRSRKASKISSLVSSPAPAPTGGSHEMMEKMIAMHALYEFVSAKLVAEDVARFRRLLADVFPGHEHAGVSDSLTRLWAATSDISDVKRACEELGLQPEPGFCRQVLQLQELLQVSSSVFIVGDSMAGKSSVWKTLARVQGEEIGADVRFMNPKALSVAELFGSMLPQTNEWRDGVFARHMRELASTDDLRRPRWLVVDGDVDPNWIETLNSVMDDNHVLTLPSNERIPLDDNMRLLFEVGHLDAATPATVSRAAVLYISNKDLGHEPFVLSWISSLSSAHARNQIHRFIIKYVNKCVDKANQLRSTRSPPAMGMVYTLVQLLDAMIARSPHLFEASSVDGGDSDASPSRRSRSSKHASSASVAIIERCFVFASIWAFGGALNLADDGVTKTQFSSWWRSTWLSVPLPSAGSVFDYYVDPETGLFAPWSQAEQQMSAVGPVLRMPSEHSTMLSYLVHLLAESGKPVLLSGQLGVGKASIAREVLQRLSAESDCGFAFDVVHCTHLTTAARLQSTLERPLHRSVSHDLVPLRAGKQAFFIDDVSMPAVDEFGTQSAIALLRQFLDSGGWYDRTQLTFKRVRGVQLLASLTHKHQARKLNARFLRHFAVVGVQGLQPAQLEAIYTEQLRVRAIQALHEVDGEHVTQAREEALVDNCALIAHCVVDLHERIQARLEGQLFSPYDRANVVRCICTARPEDLCTAPLRLVRLWAHESQRVYRDALLSDEGAALFDKALQEAASGSVSQLLDEASYDWLFSPDGRGADARENIACAFLPTASLAHGGYDSDEDERADLLADPALLMKADQERRATVRLSLTDAKVAQEARMRPLLQRKARHGPYQLVDDGLEKVRSLVKADLATLNEVALSPVKLVLFDDAVRLVTRVARLLMLPGGHALLVGVGGSGKRSVARLASFMCGFAFCEPSPGELKSLLDRAALKDERVSLFVGVRSMTPEMMSDLHDIVTGTSLSLLFDESEVKERAKATRQEVKKLLALRALSVASPSPAHDIEFADALPPPQVTEEACWAFYEDKVRRNVRVLFSFSPVGHALAEARQRFPGLATRCAAVYFAQWSYESLSSVARMRLSESQPSDTLDDVVSFAASAHLSVQSVCTQFQSAEGRVVHATPRSYLAFLQTFEKLYATHKDSVSESLDRVRLGCNKLLEASEGVSVIREQIEAVQADMQDKMHAVSTLLEQVLAERERMDKQRLTVDEERARCEKMKIDVEQQSMKMQEELASAMPAYERAMEAIDAVDRRAIAEIRSFKRMHDDVLRVFHAVLLMTARSRWNTRGNVSWDTIRRRMGREDEFLADLKGIKERIDAGKVVSTNMSAAKALLSQPGLTVENVSSKSQAGGRVCEWALNIVVYYDVSCEVIPKRKASRLAAKELKLAENALRQVDAKLSKLNARLQALTDRHQLATAEKAACLAEKARLERKLQNAERLVSSLSGEQRRWEAMMADFASRRETLLGDVLLASAFVAYAGPFTGPYRQLLLQRFWVPTAARVNLAVTPEFDPVALLADDVTQLRWQNQGLPPDRASRENAAVMVHASQWPLLLDPEQQAQRWLHALLAARDVVCMSASSFDAKQFVAAAECGQPVLIEGVEDETSWMHDVVGVTPGALCSVDGEPVEVDDAFELYLQTSRDGPRFSPELQGSVSLINFATTRRGLEERFLSLIVDEELPGLAQRHRELVQQTNAQRARVKELEDRLLKSLSEVEGEILEDEGVVAELDKGKQLVTEMQSKVAESESTEQEMQLTKDVYRPLASRMVLLHFVLADLKRLHPLYCFSIPWLVRVAQHLLRAEEVVEPDVLDGVGGEQAEQQLPMFLAPRGHHENVRQHVQRVQLQAKRESLQMNVDDVDVDEDSWEAEARHRVRQLLRSLTWLVFKSAAQGVFVEHRDVLLAHMSLLVLLQEQRVSRAQVEYFLHGRTRSRRRETQPEELSWLGPGEWSNACGLARVDGFETLVSDMLANPRQWRGWVCSERPETEDLPQQWRSADAFASLLVLRALRPDRSIVGLKRFVKQCGADGQPWSSLGAQLTSVAQWNVSSLLAEMDANSPVLFVLSPGAHPEEEVLRQVGENAELVVVPLGGGAYARAEGLLGAKVRDGGMLFLQNVHLAVDWLPRVELALRQFETRPPHPDFRLFMSFEASTKQSVMLKIPLFLLQHCTKITTEPPLDLRSNVLMSLQHFSADDLARCESKPYEYKGLVFALCVFHALLLGRHQFGVQGWSHSLAFGWRDLVHSVAILERYLQRRPSVPWEDLRFIVGEVLYGGRISNEWDQRVCRTYLARLLQPQILVGDELVPGLQLPSMHALAAVAGNPEREYEAYVKHAARALSRVSGPAAYGLDRQFVSSLESTRGQDLLRLVLGQPSLALHFEEEVVSPRKGATTTLPVSPRPQPAMVPETPKSTQSVGKKARRFTFGGPTTKRTSRQDLLLQRVVELQDQLRVCMPLNVEDLRDDVDDDPFSAVLLRECESMNALVECVSGCLKRAPAALGGDAAHLSPEMQDTLDKLYANAVPAQWVALSVSSGEQSALGPWMALLLRQYQQVRMWRTRLVVPNVVWLGGLFHPHSFVTAILQEGARRERHPLDLMVIAATVTKRRAGDEQEAACRDGSFVSGMQLQGAVWSDGVLAVEASGRGKGVRQALPFVALRAVRQDAVVDAQGVGPTYRCPVFVSSSGPFLFATEFHMGGGVHADELVLRSTAMFLR